MPTETLRLGKLAVKEDPRTFRLVDYLDTTALPVPPPSMDLSWKVPVWPMYANDVLGDCTIAAAGHMIELWTAMQGKEQSVALSTIKRVYKRLSPNDQGCVMLDVLNYWRKTGITVRHKLYAFASLDVHNHDHVKLAVALFGGVDLGFGIADANQTFSEFRKNIPWTPQAGRPSEGHCVDVVGYDDVGPLVVTWGRTQRGTWAWWDAMVDEAYVCLGQEWAKGVPIPGVDFAQLTSDLGALRG